MKRFILISVLFNVAGMIAMERPMTHAYVEQKKRNVLAKAFLEMLRRYYLQEVNIGRSDISNEQINAIESLLSEGINFNFRDKYDRSAIDYAITLNNTEITKLLIKYGADLNQKDDKGNTPLFFALFPRYVGVPNSENIKLVIENGANINAQENEGWTPLMYAVSGGNIPIVRLLVDGVFLQKQHPEQLEEISKPEEKTYLSLLPKDLRKVVFELVKVKADPNIKNKRGDTALSIAIRTLEREIDPAITHINPNQKIRNLEEIINILEPITKPQQPQESWWKRWFGY